MIPEPWLILLVLFVARTAMAYQFQTIGAVGPMLIDAYQMDFTWLGVLIGLYLLPGALVAIPSGVLGQRFGGKRILIVGLVLMVAGGLLTASDVLAMAFAGRLISGIGGIVLTVIMNKMIADWFPQKGLVLAMSIFIASWPLGIALALVSLPAVAAAWSWRVAMIVAVIIALIGLCLVMAFYRDAPGPTQANGRGFRIAMTRREWLLVSVAGLIWGVFNVGYIVLVNFAPELFTQRGYSLQDAGRIVSVLGWGLIVAVPLSGYIAERLNRPNLMMATGFICGTLLALVIPFTDALLPVFIGIVLTVGLPAGLLISLPPQVLSPENRAIGMGVFFTFYYLCMAALPAVAGRMRDLSGSPAAPMLFAAAMALLSLFGLIVFRSMQRFVRA